MDEINDDSYLSIGLHVEAIENGQLQAIMEWPVARYFGPVTIDLSALMRELQSYNTDLGFIAHTITHIDEAKLQRLRNWQNKMAEKFCLSFYESTFKGFLEQLGDQAAGRVILLGVYVPRGLIEAFPWELLGNPNNAYFLKHNVIFSVYRAIDTPSWAYRHEKTIDFLFLSSYPLDRPPLHPEYPAIQNALSTHPSVKSRSVGPALSYYQFCEQLRTYPDIVHVAIHGQPNGIGFSFARNEGSENIPVSTLVNFLKQIKSIKILVLNACYSAMPHLYETYALASLARQLVSSGLRAVIGMSTSITDRAAIEFSRWFYMELRESPGIRQAFHATIDSLRNYNQPDSILWSVPMLYINDDTNPFVEILEDAIQKNGLWFQPRELLEETLTILNEFIRAIKRIQPASHWNGFIWSTETGSILRIHIQTRQQLELVKEQLDSSSQLSHRKQAFELKRLTEEVITNLDNFVDTMPDWQKLNFKDEETPKLIALFMAKSKKLTSGMESLTSKINRLLHPR